ncbi:MAG TPA: hypothetical protein VN256_08455 [Pyrinomonadaceae bacterium]|nr:hypothetical protein [Pyrinomonadaceae bacterium]
MSLPGFTADVSLYETGRHYVTGRHAPISARQVGAVRPTMEVIENFGCRPGRLELGEGENMVCLDPDNPWGEGGGGGDWPDPPAGEPPGGSGSGFEFTEPPRPPPVKVTHRCNTSEADFWYTCATDCLTFATLDDRAYSECLQSHGCDTETYDPRAEDICPACPKSRYRTTLLTDWNTQLCVDYCDDESMKIDNCTLRADMKKRFLKPWSAWKLKRKNEQGKPVE